LTDLGSIGATHNAKGGVYKKHTSSKPAGGSSNVSSVLHLMKAANTVSMGAIVESQKFPSISRKSSESEEPIALKTKM